MKYARSFAVTQFSDPVLTRLILSVFKKMPPSKAAALISNYVLVQDRSAPVLFPRPEVKFKEVDRGLVINADYG